MFGDLPAIRIDILNFCLGWKRVLDYRSIKSFNTCSVPDSVKQQTLTGATALIGGQNFFESCEKVADAKLVKHIK